MELRSTSWIFDLVSTLSNDVSRWSSYRAFTRTLGRLVCGVIMSTNIILIFACLSLYNFDGGLMGQTIDVYMVLIHFWSNTPVYIAIVSLFELLLNVLDFLRAHQFMTVPLKRWSYWGLKTHNRDIIDQAIGVQFISSTRLITLQTSFPIQVS